MSARSFTVFQDTPPAEAPQSKAKPAVLAVVAQPPANAEAPPVSTAPLDKENFHPVTGERAGTAANPSKKRKTSSVLATKAHVPPEPKKIKAAKEKEPANLPDAKKRKSSHAVSTSSTSATSTTKSKSTVKKDHKIATSSVRRILRKRSSRKLVLPKVEEEPPTQAVEAEKEKVSKALVNSKCYDLTVKPLADVTPAFEEDGAARAKPRPAKAVSVEPEARNYFAPAAPSTSIDAAVKAIASSKKSSAEPEAKTFSTPERKRIYAAFTFCSPSPVNKEFKEFNALGMPQNINFDS